MDAIIVDGKVTKLSKSLSNATNLFNKATVTNGYYLSSGALTANASFYTSDFIAVEPRTMYIIHKTMIVNYFDSNHNYIGRQDASGNRENYLVTTPNNSVLYMRISSLITEIDSQYILKVLTNTNYNCLNANVLGDSITALNKWQMHIQRMFGLYITSYGVGGTKVSGSSTDSMNNDARVNQLSTSSNIVFFMGGTNDWAQSVPLGTEDSTDITNFYGGLNVLATKLVTRCPTARIIWMTPPYGLCPNLGWTDSTGKINNVGLGVKDYSDAVIKVARNFGFPCIDVYGNAGWNSINIDTYITNDGEKVHPNDVGSARIAQLIAGKLRSIEPVIFQDQ